MIYDMNAYLNLVNAIYELAAKDYIRALTEQDKYEIRKLKDFLTSGAYLREGNKMGVYLMEQCEKETKIALKFISDFLRSGEKKKKIDPKQISLNVLRIIVYHTFKPILKTHTDKYGQIFLVRKPL